MKHFIKNLSIQVKFTFIIIGVCALTLAIATAVFIKISNENIEKGIVNKVVSQVKMLEKTSRNAIIKADRNLGLETLSNFGSSDNIIKAQMYKENGKILSTFTNKDYASWQTKAHQDEYQKFIDWTQKHNFMTTQTKSLEDYMYVYHPIIHNDALIGSTYKVVNTKNKLHALHSNMTSGIKVLIATLIIATVLSVILLKFITSPITALTRTILRILKTHDYSIRASRTDSNDEISKLAVGFNDMIQQIQDRDEQLHHTAYYDTLTGLPNRLAFEQFIDVTVARCRREGEQATLMFIDLDGFKHVNDTLGHKAGDQLLKEVGQRLTNTLRKTDVVGRIAKSDLDHEALDEQVQYARLGGDEFTVLLTNNMSIHQTEIVAKRLIKEIGKPYHIDNQLARVTASIGIAYYPNDGEDTASLIINADLAMYQAKEVGKNQFQFYDRDIRHASEMYNKLQKELEHAIINQEFVVHFQPRVCFKTKKITCLEALVRWQHPTKGLIYPNEFIEACEDSGLIIQLGDLVMDMACEACHHWHQMGETQLHVSVNLSPKQLYTVDILEKVQLTLKKHKLAAECLEFEISEKVFMEHTEQTKHILTSIAELGTKLSIDDLGTGYSSLTYLSMYPFTVLKINHHFVNEIFNNPRYKTITKALINLAKSLNATAAAEGVETPEQMAYLSEIGCDEIQGYYLSKPVEEAEITELLKTDKIQKLLNNMPEQIEFTSPIFQKKDEDDEGDMIKLNI